MRKAIQETIDATFDDQVRSLSELIEIPSVSRGTPEPGMPLGRAVHDALTYTLSLAEKLGFSESRSLDGYCGVIDYGTGDETLMIMGHLEVVPAGSGWTGDPFKAEIRDGKLFGRGTIDDKGAMVSALYALHAVKEAGVPLKRRVRILLGCDEEVDWKCIERYKKTEPEPDLAFTPDGNYPLVHSEMGICQMRYEKKFERKSGVSITCGLAANVIPGEASAVLPFTAEAPEAQADILVRADGNTLFAKGRGGHAANPEDARNALQGLLIALAAQPLEGEDLAAASGLAALLDMDMHGEGFLLDVTDESGRLTLSPDMLAWDENGISITLDCRYPFTLDAETLFARMDAAFAALGFVPTHRKNTPGHFISPDSELVSTLLSVYSDKTGRPAKSMSIGGGTYARSFKNAVAFGPEPEGEVSVCHMPDEYVSLAGIRFNTEIMAEAIVRLAGK